MSGYAFLVNIHPELCPSGPTAFDWSVLVEGTQALGLSVEMVAAPHTTEDGPRLAQELFERVREEIDAGRCCIVWGATCAPEFAVVYGYTEDSYLVRSYRTCRDAPGCDKPLGPDESPEDPVRFDKLEAPGCITGLFLGEPVAVDLARYERQAVTRAVQLLRGRHACFVPGYRGGSDGLDAWADALEKTLGKVNPFGNAYNAKCWHELQTLAGEFCGRLTKRSKAAKEHLKAAASAFESSAIGLAEVSKLFPFPSGSGLDDTVKVTAAVRLLRGCSEQNRSAANALERAIGLL
jgi:hypothetical protein